MRAAAPLALLAAAPAAAFFSVGDKSLRDAGAEVHLKVLSNDATGEYAEVVWDVGGTVEELWLSPQGGGPPRQILASHSGNASAVRHSKMANGELLMPYANRIDDATYQWRGQTEHLPPNGGGKGTQGRDNSIHGLCYNRTLAVVAAEGGAASAHVTLRCQLAPSDFPAGYPFWLIVDVTYTLSAAGFKVEFAVSNEAPGGGPPLPFYLGWHPYFLTSDVAATAVEFDSCTEWLNYVLPGAPSGPPCGCGPGEYNENSTMIPTGSTRPFTHFAQPGGGAVGGAATAPVYWDDGFLAAAPAGCGDRLRTVIHDAAGGHAAELWQDPRALPYLQVFSGGFAVDGMHAVAVEPMSGATNAFNSGDGLHVVVAGERFTGAVGIANLR